MKHETEESRISFVKVFYFYAAHVILLLWAWIPCFTVESQFRHESTIELDLGLDSRSRAGIIFLALERELYFSL